MRKSSLLTAGCLVLTGCSASQKHPQGEALAFQRAVTSLLERTRPYALLTSSVPTRIPCAPESGTADSATRRFVCAQGLNEATQLEAARLAPAARRALSVDTSLATRRTAALLELVAGSEDRVVIHRTALRLDQLAVSDSFSPLALRDAATAHAVAAGLEGDASELLRALDLIERAASRDSSDATIRFNRAVILEHVGLVGEAAAAWERAAALPAVRAEASPRLEEQRRLDSRAEGRGVLAAAMAAGGVSDSLIAGLLEDEPVALREYALDVLLPAWGERGGRGEPADVLLHLADRIGAALATRGDSTVGTAIRLIMPYHTSPGVLAALTAYGRGRMAFDRGEFELAEPELRRALRALQQALAQDESGVALWGWPAVYLGAFEVYARRYRSADALFDRVSQAIGEKPLLALKGRALWGRALSEARQDRPQEAIDRYRAAIALFNRAGERVSAGALESQLADMSGLTGDAREAASAMVRASHAFRATRSMGTLQGFLQSFAASELTSGRRYGALAILREAVRVSRRTGRVKDVPEGLARLAAAEVQIGRTADARSHLTEARRHLARITSDLMLGGVEAELGRVEARLAQPDSSIALLDRVAEYYRRQGIPYSLAFTLVQRADVRLATGDTLGTERDLDAALELVRRRASRLDPLLAASAREVERSVFERRVALHMSRGDAQGALAELDQQRAWGTGPGRPIRELPATLSRQDAIIAFAALPDQLLTWVVTRQGITARGLPISSGELLRLASRFEALIQGGADPQALDIESEELYRILLGSVEGLLQAARRIAIVADPILAGIPFTALRSPTSKRFLVEDYATYHTFGVRGAFAVFAGIPSPQGESVQVVGNPSFDRRREPTLQPLRHAAAEADSVVSIHPRAERLEGVAATPSAVVNGLLTASLFHFSGHALAATQGMRGSRLLLAPEDSTDGGFLPAERIAGLRLGNLRLAILSACQTLSRREGGSYSYDGLAEAFLAAGAGGVIGSLWAVDDEGTTRLMARLHRELATGLAPAEALRSAQLAALREPGGGTTGLPTWAAFRYITR